MIFSCQFSAHPLTQSDLRHTHSSDWEDAWPLVFSPGTSFLPLVHRETRMENSSLLPRKSLTRKNNILSLHKYLSPVCSFYLVSNRNFNLNSCVLRGIYVNTWNGLRNVSSMASLPYSVKSYTKRHTQMHNHKRRELGLLPSCFSTARVSYLPTHNYRVRLWTSFEVGILFFLFHEGIWSKKYAYLQKVTVHTHCVF